MAAVPIPGPTLGEVIRAALAQPGPRPAISPHQWRVLRALEACRTPALGGHLYRCQACHKPHFVPHSCGNRHCPQCQGKAAIQWLEREQALLLPVPYFHLVFTLPHALNPLIAQNQRLLYKLLFDTASQTLLTFGQNRFGARIGVTAVLHTWGQTLIDHIHLHCIVTGGGWDQEAGRWVGSSGRYLFPVAALSKVFEAKYLEGLQNLYNEGQLQFHGQLQSWAEPSAFAAHMRQASRHPWVVYAKRPFAGPEQVLAYIGRYTHRVAISPKRLLALDPKAGTLTFDYKDYADGARHKTMTLGLGEFLRRFLLHILPKGFTKIRHYGLLANRGRVQRLARVRAAFPPPTAHTVPAPLPLPTPILPPPNSICPHCGAAALVRIAHIPRPPFLPRRLLDTS